jgi:hypothetical protein
MKRPVRIDGDIAYVPLTRGYEAVIDADDAALIGRWNWFTHIQRRADGTIRAIYAVRTDSDAVPKKTVLMHRVISQTPDGMECDHADTNGLNNRRDNLRSATPAQNRHNMKKSIANTSGAKGVSLHRETGRWRARIKVNGQQVSLGLYGDVGAAAAAYAEASQRLCGDFGRAE